MIATERTGQAKERGEADYPALHNPTFQDLPYALPFQRWCQRVTWRKHRPVCLLFLWLAFLCPCCRLPCPREDCAGRDNFFRPAPPDLERVHFFFGLAHGGNNEITIVGWTRNKSALLQGARLPGEDRAHRGAPSRDSRDVTGIDRRCARMGWSDRGNTYRNGGRAVQ